MLDNPTDVSAARRLLVRRRPLRGRGRVPVRLELPLLALPRRDGVVHRAGDEHLGDGRLSGDAGADGDGQSGELRVDDVTLARVHADPNAEAERGDGVPDRACAADRPRGTVEAGGEEPVTGRVD